MGRDSHRLYREAALLEGYLTYEATVFVIDVVFHSVGKVPARNRGVQV